MSGLALYGLGAAILTVQSGTDTNWPAFLPAIAVMGLGMGGIWAPMATEAMRGVPMMLAGAAAGVNNTLRQVGSVVGSAAVGALLQNQLASTLRDEATKRSGALPADLRSRFVEGFAASAKGGIAVGPSHAATPSGIPADVAAKIQQVGLEVFQHGYVRAMHPTLILPIAAAFVASALCLLATRHTTGQEAGGPATAPTTEGARRRHPADRLSLIRPPPSAASRGHRVGAARELPVRSDEVARGAVGVPFEVVLILGFGLPEATGRRDLSHRFRWPEAGGVHVRDRVFCDRPLLVGRVEDGRPVLRADVVSLAVLRRWIVDLEEELEQVAVGELLRIEVDLGHFGVTAEVVLRRVGDVAAGVANPGRDHSGLLAQELLHSPKASPSQDR
jgi:hypothetical protein